MNKTPRGSRIHIVLFGRRNAGKSSLFNALSGQEMAMVSELPGTTTDPVYKSVEILPLGPCELIDTAGLDDEGLLGQKRIDKSREIMNKADIALLLIDPETGLQDFERALANDLQQKNIPLIPVITKSDLQSKALSIDYLSKQIYTMLSIVPIQASSISGEGVEALKARMIEMLSESVLNQPIVGDLLSPGDLCILVCPIDSAAPKGRLILPQVQTIRDILDHFGQAMVVRETELADALNRLNQKPDLVITDSQVFQQVNAILPQDILLTSFSILFARYKGDLQVLMDGLKVLDDLKPNDRIMIAEACTHHRQEDDIGTVKIPQLLRRYTGFDLEIHHCSGYDYPADLDTYRLLIHCGACMLNRKEMLSRIQKARQAGVPITNYGLFLAYVQGILPRLTLGIGLDKQR